MGLGAGNLQTLSRSLPGGGGGVTGADSGLSMFGTIAELGQPSGTLGDPAQLLHNTEIPLKNFVFSLLGNFGRQEFYIDPFNQLYLLGDIDAEVFGSHLQITDATRTFEYKTLGRTYLDINDQEYRIGDIAFFNNNTLLAIDDISQLIHLGQPVPRSEFILDIFNQTAQINFGANNFFSIDPGVGQLYTMGDRDVTLNGSYTAIDDTLQQFTFYSGSGGSVFLNASFGNSLYQLGDISLFTGGNNSYIEVNDAAETFEYFSAGKSFLKLDPPNGQYLIGDIFGFGNYMQMIIDDTAQITEIRTNAGGDAMLLLNAAAGIYEIGDISGMGSNLYFSIDDTAEKFTMNESGNQYFIADTNNAIYQLGDINGTNGFSFLTVWDAANRMYFNSNVGGLGTWLDIDAANGLFSIGAGLGTGTYFAIDSPNKVAHILDGASEYFKVDALNQLYQLGDISGAGTILKVDDAAGLIRLQAANGIETSDPNGAASAGDWRLGKPIAAVVAFDVTQYVEVNIGGTVVKLAVAV